MFKITLPVPNTPGLTLTLIGIVSMRIFNNIAERLGITPTAAIQTLQDRINKDIPSCKALPTTLGDSNRFLFALIKGDNSVPNLTGEVTEDVISDIIRDFPEIKAPNVQTETELFNYVVPDFTIIH